MQNYLKFVVCIFMLILLLVQQLIYPLTILGKPNTPHSSNDHTLYQTTEEIILDDKIIIHPDTYLYGVEKEESPNKVYIQLGTTEKEISLEQVESVQITEDSSAYEAYNLKEIVDLNVDESEALYANHSNEEVRITFLQATTYPVIKDDLGFDTLLIGNVAYHLGEDNNEEELVNTAPDSDTKKVVEQDNVDSNFDETIEEETEQADVPIQEDPEPSEIDEQPQGSIPSKNSASNADNQGQDQSSTWEGNSSNYFKVIEDKLPIYDNRSGELIKVGELEKGQVYPRVSSYGSGWHKIQFGTKNGYVYALGTTPASGSNQNTTYKNQSRAIKTLQDVTVYDNSSGKLVPFATLNKGINYPIVSDYGSWWRVLLSDRVGYVHKDAVKGNFTSSDNYFRVLTDNLPIYDNRTGMLVKVGELTKGQVYPRIGAYGSNWHKIQFGNIHGYVYVGDTESVNATSIRNENINYKNQTRTLTPINTVTVYDNSSGKLVEFGKLIKGKSYPIASDYGNWWRIILGGRVGYVSKDAVKSNFTTNDKYFRVLTDNLPIYDNRSGKLVEVGRLTKGQVYPRISAYGSNWHKIQYGNISGYVYSKDTESACGNQVKNEVSSFKSQSRTINPLTDVPVYDNSSGELVEFGKLNRGKSYPKVSDYGNWWKVAFAGREGYVHKDAVKLNFLLGDKYFKVIANNLPVYDNRGGSLTKVGELRKGQTYPIVSDYGNWWRVQYGKIYGYVNKSGTEYGSKSSIININTSFTHSKDTRIVATNDVEIRDNSSGKLVPFGKLTNGAIYPVASDYGNWWRIIYLGRVGYVHKSNVQVYKDYGLDPTVKEYRTKNTVNIMNRLNLFFNSASSNYVNSADNILKNRFQISSYGTFDFSNGIPWGKSPDGQVDSRAYYRALHGHFFLNDLISAYKSNGNKQYIYKGYEIISDWTIKNPYGNAVSSMAWHDEGTAQRLITWVNFYDVARDVLEDFQLEILLNNMLEHADLLLTDKFHSSNTNHGMFQDESLLVFNEYFNKLPNSEEYNNVSKQRLKKYFNYIISSEGVHLEHSPEYHLLIAGAVKRYRNFFGMKKEFQEFDHYNKIYNDMAHYSTWIIKPDGRLPLIGDTFGGAPRKDLWEDNGDYIYSRTSGGVGTKPKGHSAVFKDAGYAIFRGDWEKGIDSTYIHFTAAYHTAYHKHSDDLSVWIYANGQDIVTEAGPNGYDYDLPFTKYAYSSFAHNTLIVNDKGLPRVDGKYNKTYLEDYSIGDSISAATGINKRFENVTHKRKLEYNRDSNKITVKDHITSPKNNNYKLLWNLAEGVTPVLSKTDDNLIHLYADNKEIMTLEVKGNTDFKIKSVKGQTEPYLLGWHIRDRNEPVETYTLVLETDESTAEIESIFTVK